MISSASGGRRVSTSWRLDRRALLLATCIAACGSDTAVSNPQPQIAVLVPDTASQGSRAIQISVTGSGFVESSRVLWNGVERATAFASSTSLTAQLPASDFAVGGTATVSVRSPAPGGGTSGGARFTIWNFFAPVPTLASITPDRAPVGATALTVRLNGAEFVPNSHVLIDGYTVATTFVSVTTLDARLADTLFTAGAVHQVAVNNPFPGGGTTKALTFSVENPQPALSSLSVSSVTAGQAGAVITVDGSGFIVGTVVRFNGAPRPTTHVTSTRLTAQLLSGDLRDPGTFDISVFTSAPGGGASSTLPLTVVARAPVITSLPSASAVVGSANASIAVDGSGFVPGAVVTINGQDRATTFFGWNRLSFALASSDVAVAGPLTLSVRNPGTAGNSPPATLTIRNAPAPTIASVIKIPGQATDFFYDPGTARIYAPMRSGPNRGRLIAIDPSTGVITASVAVDEPGRIELSSDARHLFVVLLPAGESEHSEIRRLSFPSLTTEAQFSLAYPAFDIQTVPGSPLSVVVAEYSNVQLFEDGVLRNTKAPPFGIDVTQVTQAPVPGAFYGVTSSSSAALLLLSFGTEVQTTGLMSDVPGVGIVAYAGGRLYAGGVNGQSIGRAATIDPELSITKGRFPGFGGQMLPDPLLGRLYLLSGSILTAYDLNTFLPLGSINVDPSVPTLTLDLSYGRMVKWGTDGLAVRDLYNLYIFRTGLAAP